MNWGPGGADGIGRKICDRVSANGLFDGRVRALEDPCAGGVKVLVGAGGLCQCTCHIAGVKLVQFLVVCVGSTIVTLGIVVDGEVVVKTIQGVADGNIGDSARVDCPVSRDGEDNGGGCCV